VGLAPSLLGSDGMRWQVDWITALHLQYRARDSTLPPFATATGSWLTVARRWSSTRASRESSFAIRANTRRVVSRSGCFGDPKPDSC
jgi:hypothetical protein